MQNCSTLTMNTKSNVTWEDLQGLSFLITEE